ncbi:glycosyl hydrolase 53 domain protein (plasmid) [Gemmatirosa kalamazoonensis]|uniref:Arabinogalactan endo-beta-1,4-galactanase n=2 Tax=Gemmatirosa kalamazoonensis TaxID=861299 RepID=W0RUN6_9BACT|nr:glycosyl hydrolase 53 domain protein [Gemmatirosa kalamazoonensis]
MLASTTGERTMTITMSNRIHWRRKGAVLVAILGVAAMPATSLAQARPSGVFYLGADISALAGSRPPLRPPDSAATSATPSVPSARARRASFVYRENGVETTEYAIMRKHGWNAFRLRVFVSPVRNAPDNSLENTLPLARAIKDAGAMFLLDIHYSDTWADPGHQDTPAAWRELDAAAMEQKVEEYTRDVISQFKAAGAMPDMVQIGNEITGGLLWPLGHLHVPSSEVKQEGNEPMRGGFIEPYDEARVWGNVTRFLKAGIRGVKAASGGAPPKIILHTDTGGDWQVTRWWFDHVAAAKVDYDIMGLSFYPKYHGTLAMLQRNMIESRRRYHKPFMVVETGYVQNDTGAMSSPEAIARPVLSAKGPKARGFMQWPGTPQGQLQYMADVINTVRRNHGLGVFYWGPEGTWGDGMWSPDGSAAPAIYVLDHLDELRASPASRIPPAGASRPH